MTSTTAQRLRALDLLKARGMLRLKEFVAEGIGPETLARLVREHKNIGSGTGGFCSFRAPEPANFEALGAPTRWRSISHDARGPPWAPT